MTKTLKIGWWNTGFAPPTTKKAKSKRTLSQVIKIVKSLFLQKGIELLGLCEMSEAAFMDAGLQSWMAANNIKFDVYGKKFGNLVWDLGILYKEDSISVTDFLIVDENEDSLEHKKTAGKWSLLVWDKPLDIYLSHFAQSSTRSIEKRDIINRIITSVISNPGKIEAIAMGDYNIQLCEEELYLKIDKSRQRSITNRVYSPFWRFCSEKYGQSVADSISGTTYFNGEWHLLDYFFYNKILTDTNNVLYCDEDDFGILDDIFAGTDLKKQDHLPVYITLKGNL